MPKPQSEALQGALAAFAPKLKYLLERNELSESALGRALKRQGESVSTKTINNLAAARENSKLGTLAVIADHFGVPLWVMLIPKLPNEMIEGDALKRLAGLIDDYVEADAGGRKQIENLAEAFAQVTRLVASAQPTKR